MTWVFKPPTINIGAKLAYFYIIDEFDLKIYIKAKLLSYDGENNHWVYEILTAKSKESTKHEIKFLDQISIGYSNWFWKEYINQPRFDRESLHFISENQYLKETK